HGSLRMVRLCRRRGGDMSPRRDDVNTTQPLPRDGRGRMCTVGDPTVPEARPAGPAAEPGCLAEARPRIGVDEHEVAAAPGRRRRPRAAAVVVVAQGPYGGRGSSRRRVQRRVDATWEGSGVGALALVR